MAATGNNGNRAPAGGSEKRSLGERGRGTVAKARAKGEELLAQAEARRPTSAVVDVTFRSIEHDANVGGGIIAGALAFRVFLFLVPLVFFFVYAFGLAADAAGRSPRELAETAGIAGLVAASINASGDQSLWSRITIMVVAGTAMVIASRTLMKSLHAVHLIVWGLPRVRYRNSVVGVGTLIFSVALGLALVQATARMRNVFLPGFVLADVAFMAFPFGVWLLGSLRLFPRPPETTWRDLVPGAILVAVGVELLQFFTLIWISRSFERRSETYGAIGGSLALLLWAYVVGRILCGAVVLNVVMWRRMHSEEPPA